MKIMLHMTMFCVRCNVYFERQMVRNSNIQKEDKMNLQE